MESSGIYVKTVENIFLLGTQLVLLLPIMVFFVWYVERLRLRGTFINEAKHSLTMSVRIAIRSKDIILKSME
jgi:hypothetical protein